jgi:NAD(P)-dependent dehydrogenase (short-subunit alcohol dehydrogenase family)
MELSGKSWDRDWCQPRTGQNLRQRSRPGGRRYGCNRRHGTGRCARAAVVPTAGEMHPGRAAMVQAGALPGTIHQTVEEITRMGGQALAIRCDITREDDIKAMVSRVVEHFGQIDHLD